MSLVSKVNRTNDFTYQADKADEVMFSKDTKLKMAEAARISLVFAKLVVSAYAVGSITYMFYNDPSILNPWSERSIQLGAEMGQLSFLSRLLHPTMRTGLFCSAFVAISDGARFLLDKYINQQTAENKSQS